MTRESFGQLYMQLLPGLYRLAVSILHQREDAMDAVQQAAEKAWKASGRIRDGGERAYITKIVINECREIQRYRMRVVPRSEFPEGKEPEADPDLAEAVFGLPERDRLPLLMKYMEGYSEQETAEALGISRAALKSRLFRARMRLRNMMLETEGKGK